MVSQLQYSGSIFTSDCTLDAEIQHRVAEAHSAAVFQQLRQANIWFSRALTLSVKMQFFQCTVMSALLYAGDTGAVVHKNVNPFGCLSDELLDMHLWYFFA